MPLLGIPKRKGERVLARAILILAFAICFICFALRSLYVHLRSRSERIAKSKGWLIATYIIMAFLWLGWFSMNFNDPFRIALPLWLRYCGLVLFVIGFSLFILSHIGLKRLSGGEKLVTTGIYSKIRNPMYIGFIIWVIGFPLFMGSIITLASAVFWIFHFLYWKTVEERELEKRFEEYTEYRKRTWF